ncbi:beta barrel domain-containing protein [Spirosoma sordidisoli]|uniref:Uncharacterized protein n=1 Tax=Spirosoma sordidisoli TaxID=2502893 RepID=A0A4Q2US58_9BACT|nr:hypothetical protein [Spirosoma sordidisoli]RYC69669.1 hypothetical protein EQG79_13795 [Spirosoma sordidisoli]
MKKGDIVFVSGIVKDGLKAIPIDNVGPKYITLTIGSRLVKFYIDTLYQVTKYSATYRIYTTEQAYYDEAERNTLTSAIANKATQRGRTNQLPLESLRTINSILDSVTP